MENYSQVLDQVTYVQTFRALRVRYEQQQERVKDRNSLDTVPALLRNSTRYRRDPRQLDEEEEMWFNEEDDPEDGDGVVPASNSPELMGGRKVEADLDSIGMTLFFSKLTICM